MATREESLGFLLADVSRMMRRAFLRRLDGATVTLAEARTLVYVSRHEGVRQVALAELLEVQPITLARLLDKLERAGLVERRPDPTDRRAYRIFLTSEAAPRLLAIEDVAALIRRDALRNFSKPQAAELLSALRKIRDNLASRG